MSDNATGNKPLLNNSLSTDFDVLVVGSGAGGGMAAMRLCEQGFKVGLIERGPRFDPKKDYILNHSDWELRKDPLDQAKRREQTIDKEYRSKYQAFGVEHRRSALNYHRVHGVGGSTLHYQGEAHRFGEHAFSTLSKHGYAVDWPLGYDDLRPYYRQAEDLLGVAGEVGNPFKPQRAAFPTPAHALSARSIKLAQAATKAGFNLQPNTLALPSQSIDGRLPCQHSGGCNYGCVFNAKSSIDQAIIPRAEATNNLSLLTQTQVTKLNLDKHGEIQNVSCVSKGATSTLTAKRYVLAGGALETPRLMLASAQTTRANGFGNSHDQVGRYFMETVMTTSKLRVESALKTYTGPPLDARVWDFCKPIDEMTSGFVLGNAGYLTPHTGPYNHAVRQAGIGRAHKQLVRQTFGQSLLLFGIAEQEPQADNRVQLSAKLDPNGMPKVTVHCRYSERDLHTLKVMNGKLKAWAHATGDMRISSSRDTHAYSAATHVGGTCRMGNNAKDSVVDANGKVHDSNNTYVADASVLPTQGMGDSPSLTIQALALRTADKIIDDLRTS